MTTTIYHLSLSLSHTYVFSLVHPFFKIGYLNCSLFCPLSKIEKSLLSIYPSIYISIYIYRVKYTGYRTFNSLYPCHGKGDMIVSFPSLNGTERRKIMHEFLEYTNIEDGSLNITTDSPNHPLLEPTCKEPLKHHCHTKKMCDKQFSSRNKHGHCGH
mmetsp:Transcript_9202/g.12055  ORF Transcript_9202/g.12055 Transcript_9202/m.12055 type:complete len:157 (+) Transcript_9202:761-1231(+)